MPHDLCARPRLAYNGLSYLKEDGLKLRDRGYPMQDMIRYVVNSKLFLEK